jgi:hypothetical protein
MAGKVFFSVMMSLDGFIAPESMEWLLATPGQREQDPRLERCMAQWMELQAWISPRAIAVSTSRTATLSQ